MAKALNSQALESALQALPAWAHDPAAKVIIRDFKFKDFAHAFDFMTRVAAIAEDMNHHPEWTNVYNKVSVRLTTHDAGDITQKDIDLATAMDEASAG